MNAIPNNVAGFWLSEKLDGVFCRWTGTAYQTRNGHRLTPPAWWLVSMPPVMLDGELWNHRGGFDELVSAIQRKRNPWEGVSFQVFDMPILRVPFEQRIAALGRLQLPEHCHLLPHRVCDGRDDLDSTEVEIVAAGGEGCVLRAPGSFYRPGNFTKIKRIYPDLNRSQLDS